MLDIVLLGGLVVGLVQVVKVTLALKARYIPITALVLSLCVFSLYAGLSEVAFDWTLVSTALVTALTAVGLWSGAKSTFS